MTSSVASILPSAIPLPLPPDQLREIVSKSKDWALMHGAAMRQKNNFSPDTLAFAPFILTPSAFPRVEFARAVNLQKCLNELMHKVAHDREFLTHCLKETVSADDFTGELYRIYEIVMKEGPSQLVSLGLLRSDYMVHSKDNNKIKQVELNTIASSFGGIGTLMRSINRFVLEELGHSDKIANLPENDALTGLCLGMLEAHKIYSKPNAAILFLVEDITYNICDQRFHEFEIHRINPGVAILRRTLTEITEHAKLGPNKELILEDVEIAVIYFRAGYSPDHYHSTKEWDARLLMERSRAIKCPSIHYHLAGCKKVQQELARPGVLEKFIHDPEKIRQISDIFTGLYSLDFDEFGNKGLKLALENPERFVLKPQREGGGNNIYGEDIRAEMLKMQDTKERTGFILMERIHPPISRSYMIRPGGPELPEIVDLISELGIFGAIIGDAQKIYYNEQVGHMLRTKMSSADEGGVAAGLGALDSPYLIDL